MISDSIPWRDDLAKVAERLRKREHQARWTERTGYLVERDLMTGMFAIRRLIESGKCSSRLPKRRLPVQLCIMTGREPDLMDRWAPWDHYDLENVRPTELDVLSLTHQFIHSYILSLDFADDMTFIGVFVGSDRAKRSHLYRVDLHTIIGLFEYVAREGVVHSLLPRGDGVSRKFTISQHDMVEAGLAEYYDQSKAYVTFLPSSDDDAAVRRAFPELEVYSHTRFTVPRWGNLYEHHPEV